MPKFIYTIAIFCVASWISVYKYVHTYAPDQFGRILIFLGLVFISLLVTLSLPIYFYLQKQAPTFSNLRFLYRKSLRHSLFATAGIVFLMGLRAFGLDNIVNVTLFLLFYVLLFTQVRGKR